MTPLPHVFAHRGSSAALPEHTLAAYQRAIEEGADGLECDVRMSRDGHLVCVHDRRLERTSNGRGLVSAYTLAELEQLDFGSWHPGANGGGPPDPDRTRLLTLDRLLNAVQEADRDIHLLIETKHPSRQGAAVEHKLVAMLRQRGLVGRQPEARVRVTVMSFSPLAVRRIRELAPELPTVLLLEVLPPGLLRRGRLPFGAHVAGPSIELVRARPQLLPALHAAGHSAYVWTVNQTVDLDLIRGYGVAGVITDRPRLMLDHLGR